jgi:predicted alpha/beta superfamily hydrolase
MGSQMACLPLHRISKRKIHVNRPLIAVPAIFCALAVLASNKTATPSQSIEKAAPLTIGEAFTIDSKILGEKRRINVYLPPPYTESPKVALPVLYMPDGGMAEDFLHVAGLVQVSIGNGTMRPFILVGIENTKRRRDLTSPTQNAEDKKIAPKVGGAEAFRKFIRQELMPDVKSRYRTAKETAIVGESLAGLFVVETFFLEPDLFDTYIAFDPSLWWNDQKLLGDAAERLRAWPKLEKTLYFAHSDEKEIAQISRRFAAILAKNAPPGIHWHHEEMPEEQHSTIFHPAALKAFRNVFKPKADGPRQALEYAPAPVDNPLRGLVPYAADVRDRFPHSLEFNYLPLSALVVGPDRYDWKSLETLLDDVAGRGHQAVFRVFVEYPGKKECIPPFLVKEGLTVHRYVNPDAPSTESLTPDYENPRLRKVLKEFIAALGKKYDGDPRIGFLTAGLLGAWGEWHTYPKPELFASKAVQTEVLDAYEAAFQITPILLRYPAGAGHYGQAPNSHRRFGYHDDSFAWATLDTGKKDDQWFFVPALKTAGKDALDKWQTQPIGGEIRPEAWGKVFDEKPGDPRIQDFRRCVQETHATWLMDSGMFQKKQDPARIVRAEAEVRRMGYEYHVAAVTLTGPANGKLRVRLELVNRGVAPFYYDWPVEYGLIDGKGPVVRTMAGSGKLKGLLPGGQARVWDDTLDVPAGAYTLGLRVPNTLKNGPPLRFANKTQDAKAKGWLMLTAWE